MKIRAGYSEEDMAEAVRLVVEEQMTIKAASLYTNEVKCKPVPRMTLSDRLRKKEPTKHPNLGRPHELDREAEEALVKCLEMCSSFNYPMKRGELRLLIQR